MCVCVCVSECYCVCVCVCILLNNMLICVFLYIYPNLPRDKAVTQAQLFKSNLTSLN